MKTCKYKLSRKKLGEGTFGVALLASKDSRQYVFKKLKEDKESKTPGHFADPVELDILFRLRSPYLMEGIDIAADGECGADVGVVTEYIAGNLMKDIGKFTYSQKKRILYDFALGLRCMHDNKYLHLDIKLDNTLYHPEVKPRGVLIDYGMAQYCPNGVKEGISSDSLLGTYYYISPKNSINYATEDDPKLHYTDKDDIWALALTYCEMFSSLEELFYDLKLSEDSDDYKDFKNLHKFFKNKLNKNKINKYLDETIFYDKFIPKEEQANLRSLLKSMLELENDKRFSIHEVINHPYFAEFNDHLYCSMKNPKKYSLRATEDHVNTVNHIVSKCIDKIPDRNLLIVFMAIDIYLRVISQCQNVHKDIDLEKRIPNLPDMCILIANKYLNWSNSTEFDGLIEDHLKEENLIYKILGGLVNEERYLCHCRNLREAQKVIANLLTDEGINRFLLYDGKEYIKSLGIENYPTKPTGNLKISDLLVH